MSKKRWHADKVEVVIEGRKPFLDIYMAAARLRGSRTVILTSTKGLQDQLAGDQPTSVVKVVDEEVV